MAGGGPAPGFCIRDNMTSYLTNRERDLGRHSLSMKSLIPTNVTGWPQVSQTTSFLTQSTELAKRPFPAPTPVQPIERIQKNAALQISRRRPRRHPNPDLLHSLIHLIRNHSVNPERWQQQSETGKSPEQHHHKPPRRFGWSRRRDDQRHRASTEDSEASV
jgi:hypothetical protein